MTHFYEGQDVEVSIDHERGWIGEKWRKAKIIRMAPDGGAIFNPVYETTLGLFDEAHIRALTPAEEYPGLAEPDDDPSDPMGSAVQS